jgi:hypothetical protein
MKSFYAVLFFIAMGSVAQADITPDSTFNILQTQSFRQSCNILREFNGMVEANCRAINGRWVYNRVDISRCSGDVTNSNGTIVCTGNSSYPGYNDGRGGNDRGRGGYDHGRGGYDHGRGGYDHGRGGYDHGRGGYNLPPGSYLRSCTSCQADGQVLQCVCTSSDRRSFRTSIYYRQCRGDISNTEGQLTCQ